MPKKPELEYERKVLYCDKQAEVVLITWPPGSKSPAHDHGISHGLVKIVGGEIYQKVYSKKTKKLLKSAHYRRGNMFLETPEIIHVMGNSSKKPAQTLHVYLPPVKMKNYSL